MNKWKKSEPVCSGIVPSGLMRGCGGRRPVWGLSSRFADPAGHAQTPKISDVPFSGLKATFTHLVLDLSKGYTAIDLIALEMANHILLTTQLDLPCLRNVVRLMMSFGNMEGLAEKVKIIVNRVGLENGQITLKKAEETIGKEIFWQLPNDYRTMIEARNNGIPLIEQAPKAAITQSLIAMAKALSGDDKVKAPEVANKKANLGGLFGLWGAKRGHH